MGCGPVYEPSYRLEPPVQPNAVPAQCLADCAVARSACLVAAHDGLQACATRASLSQDLCRSRAQLDFQICQKAFAPQGSTCVYRICDRPICAPTAIEACEASHRQCFAGCGGTVVEEQRCVENCPS